MASSPPSTTSPTSRSRAPPSRPTRCPGRAWWSATAGSCSEPRAMNDPLAAIRASAAKYPAIALVLQGGGALGAYQCGVYQGLHEAGIRPNWLAGISRSEEHTSELQSLMRISYAVFCVKKQNKPKKQTENQ